MSSNILCHIFFTLKKIYILLSFFDKYILLDYNYFFNTFIFICVVDVKWNVFLIFIWICINCWKLILHIDKLIFLSFFYTKIKFKYIKNFLLYIISNIDNIKLTQWNFPWTDNRHTAFYIILVTFCMWYGVNYKFSYLKRMTLWFRNQMQEIFWIYSRCH